MWKGVSRDIRGLMWKVKDESMTEEKDLVEWMGGWMGE
jgi:hypothetical protein